MESLPQNPEIMALNNPENFHPHVQEIDSVPEINFINMVDVLTFEHNCLPKRSRETEQTQIRLLLKKQSDQGLPCLLF